MIISIIINVISAHRHSEMKVFELGEYIILEYKSPNELGKEDLILSIKKVLEP